MFDVFIYSIIITVLFSPYGIYFLKDFKPDIYNFSKQLIFSSIIICFFALVLNFFFPLNKWVNSSIIILSFFLIIKNKKYFLNKNFFKFIILQSFLITILIYESDVYRPDAGLYHLPFIGILNSEKIIFGISNLHSRYGHISILQYYSAISNNFLFYKNGIVFAPAIIASSVIINLITQIYRYIKKKNYNFHFLFIFFIFIFICYKMNRYGEYGNDAPAHFLLFFLISELLIKLKDTNHEDFGNNLIITLFIIQNKITLIFVIFLNFIYLKKKNIWLFVKNKRFIFVSLFFSLWILNNILSTGCLIYPIQQTCFKNFIWTNIDSIKEVSLSSEVWTKDWSNFENNSKITQKEFLKDFNWLETWSENHFLVILKILVPYIIFCIILILFLTFKNKKNNNKIKNIHIHYFIIFILGSIFWFLKSPLYRYGYSFLICTIAFIFTFYCSKFDFYKKRHNLIFVSILLLGIFTIIGKNVIRINKTNNNYYNHPWPKYYAMNNDNSNKVTEFKINEIDKKRILTPINGYCMYIEKICSHYSLKKNLKIKKINSYIIFYLEN
ncbi:LIC_10190 family membrane protein [Candidatus Pelagibacter sp.]|uniref:LIC_10190 family membrane protein n=1 Tax=Candidatus Pelagibacter sp. TaxID=2024849 RepID=UPI003F85AD1A